MNRESGGSGSPELKLRRRDENPDGGSHSDAGRSDSPLATGARVVLYSERLEREITVELTHLEGSRLGGHLVEDPGTPLMQPGDHLHFKRCHVMRRDG